MNLLEANGLEKWFDGRLVVRVASIRVNRGDRIGLIGPNGCGKTTLLGLLSREIEPDGGTVRIRPGVRVECHTEAVKSADESVDDYLAPAHERIDALEREMRDLEPRLADDAAALERYADASSAFERAGGYDFAGEVARVLGGLGFAESERSRPTDELSDGERARLSLARVLLDAPDVLLLDEPTNHLDLGGLEWLERFLLERERAFVVVSHDRYFLDRVSARTWSFDGPDVRAHRGGYSASLPRLGSGRDAADRAGAAGGSRSGALTGWRPAALPARGSSLLETTALVLGYDRDRPIVTTPPLHVAVGSRIGVVGPNASGKTTLLRTLAGALPALEGYVRTTADARAAVLEGSAERWFAERVSGTVLESFGNATGLPEQEARELLARFLFKGDDVLRDASALSAGERRRLAWAALFARPANLLVLDEPTEHLDIDTREALGRVLLEFSSAVLIVSHDRYLLDRVATDIWLVQGGTLRAFEGNYSAMRRLQDGMSRPVAPPRRTRGARARPQRVAARRDPSLAELEGRIAAIEQRLESLAQRVSEIAQAGNYLESRRVGEEYAQLERSLRELYDDWASRSRSRSSSTSGGAGDSP